MVVFTACNDQQKTEATTQPSETFFPKGEKLVRNNFTGAVWLHYLVRTDSIHNVNISSVSFEPGARTNWTLTSADKYCW